jgi:hypothetical protein
MLHEMSGHFHQAKKASKCFSVNLHNKKYRKGGSNLLLPLGMLHGSPILQLNNMYLLYNTMQKSEYAW